MNIIEAIVGWYQHITKVATVLAVPGGIWFWVDKYRNRIHLKVRSLDIPLSENNRLTFEVENVGAAISSLEPIFTLTGYSMGRVPKTFQYTIETLDRQVPVHVPKQITASHGGTENDETLWFLSFRLRLTRGGATRVRFRNMGLARLGFFRFHFERLRYLWFGVLPHDE